MFASRRMEPCSSLSEQDILHLFNDMTYMSGEKVHLRVKPFHHIKETHHSTSLSTSVRNDGQHWRKQTNQTPGVAEVNKGSIILTKICKDIINHFKICVIAGGYVSFVSGDTNSYNDIDFFIPVLNGPSSKTILTRTGQVTSYLKKCSCLTSNNLQTLIDTLRSKERAPIVENPTIFIEIIKIESTCDKSNINKYLLSSRFCPSLFPTDIYDPYYLSHIVTIWIDCKDANKCKLHQFKIQLIFVSSIYVTNNIYNFQAQHKKSVQNKAFTSFMNNKFGVYVVEFFDLWITKKFIFFDFACRQFILVEPFHIYASLKRKPLKEINLFFLFHLQEIGNIFDRHQNDILVQYAKKPMSGAPPEEYQWLQFIENPSEIQITPHFMVAPFTSDVILFQTEKAHLLKYSLRVKKYLKRIRIHRIADKREVFKLQKIVFIYILRNVNIYKIYEIYSSLSYTPLTAFLLYFTHNGG